MPSHREEYQKDGFHAVLIGDSYYNRRYRILPKLVSRRRLLYTMAGPRLREEAICGAEIPTAAESGQC